MSYDTEKNITRGGLDELVARNASGISNRRGPNMPVMVPIQEKNWDIMVGMLKDTVSFQPKVYSLMKKLLTDEQMANLLNQYLEQEQSICKTMAASLQRQENQVLERMEDLAQQAGKNLEKSLNDSLAKGSQLEAAIAKAAKRRSWKTCVLIIAVSMLASALGAIFYTLAALSEDDEEPEERRRRIEAQENGEILGTIIGLTAGIISDSFN